MLEKESDNTTEYSISQDVIVNQCLMHEIENDFTCPPECYRLKVQSTNVGHIGNGRYYECGGPSSTTRLFEKSVINEIDLKRPMEI